MRINNPRTFFQVLFVVLVLICIGAYFLFQSKDVREGPIILVEKPQNGFVSQNPLIEISGTAEHIAFITLNDKNIFLDENNSFNEKLLIPPGVSIIKLQGKDKFEKSTEVKIHVFGDYQRTDYQIKEATSTQELATSTNQEI